MRNNAYKDGDYANAKGQTLHVLGTARDSHTEEYKVVYRPDFGDDAGKLLVIATGLFPGVLSEGGFTHTADDSTPDLFSTAKEIA